MFYEKALTIFKELPLMHRAACAIFCAKEVCDEPAWNAWADGWLSGADQSREKAEEFAIDFQHNIAMVACSIATWLPADVSGITEGWSASAALNIIESHPKEFLLVLTTHFVCPHCYGLPDQHTKSGKCLFGAHTWENINNSWRP